MAAAAVARTHLHDLPEPLLLQVFSLVGDVRSRNAMALVCRRWRAHERLTRRVLALRGNPRAPPFLLPAFFPSVSHLDLSLLSPWGHPFLSPLLSNPNHPLLARRLALAFPAVSSLSVYARSPDMLLALAPQWPCLRHARLVRWHQRPAQEPLGADLAPLLAACPRLASLDLSSFYCWTEDVPEALGAHPAAAASLSSLNLLLASATQGFRKGELLAVAAACPALRRLVAPAIFDRRYFGHVDDGTLQLLASSCPRLQLLHLVDASASALPLAQEDAAGITAAGLKGLFAALPDLEDLVLDLRHCVLDAAPALEELGRRCPRVRSLQLGRLQGVCRAKWDYLDGVAVCGGLESLSIKNCNDLTDSGLVAIGRGCRKLSKLEIHGCSKVTAAGIRRLAEDLWLTLLDVSVSGCPLLDTAQSLRALEPIRDRVERIHIDCVWVRPTVEHSADAAGIDHEDELDGDDDPPDEFCESAAKKRKCCEDSVFSDYYRSWERLRQLSLWFPAGEELTPLAGAGLYICPALEEVRIKVEGDCRTCERPARRVFGLSVLGLYPRLARMQLDLGEAIGNTLTAPTGQMDLSPWERFYLHGIGELSGLEELEYWPPQDRDMNQRKLSLPATGLIQGCAGLRKLFIHGTAHEHFLCFFLGMPNLRDVQLREDYYPAPEDDMSTEMRAVSCARFEAALNHRQIPD